MHKFKFLILIVMLSSFAAQADEKYEALLKRIEELEKTQDDLILEVSNKQPQVNSFLSNNLAFGGFFEPAYTFIEGPDTKSQSANSSNILGINIAAEYKNDLRFVSQFITGLSFPLNNPNNSPNAAAAGQSRRREFGNLNFGAVLTQGYLEYNLNSNLAIQGGLGYVPFGYAAQQRELVLFIRRGGPQLLRTRTLISQLWSGINIQGDTDILSQSLRYNLYTFSPLEGGTQPGIGGRLSLASINEKTLAGLSVQTGKINQANYQTVGTDLRLNMDQFILTTEAVYGFFEFQDPWSVYLEPAYFIVPDKVLVFFFGDYSNNTKNRVGASLNSSLDPVQKWEYGAGLNWLPTSYTRLRFSVTMNDYVGENDIISGVNRDYIALDVSAGIAF